MLFTALAVLYVAVGFVAARRAAVKTAANPLLTFAAMATMHATYGAGFVRGWWRERRRLRSYPR
jgi:hypothetical protein